VASTSGNRLTHRKNKNYSSKITKTGKKINNKNWLTATYQAFRKVLPEPQKTASQEKTPLCGSRGATLAMMLALM